jgi:cellulose synthase operon protein C
VALMLTRLVLALALAVPTVASAQKPAQEVSVQRGPASELYIRKRPPSPEAPVLSEELKKLLVSTEKKRDDKRLEAIGLLRGFLASRPTGDARADGMFKLAELLWEEARRTYLIRMEAYGRALEKCAQAKGECAQPKEPRIGLQEAEALYIELHAKFPNFRRMDLVTYLIGFAAKEAGREDEAMSKFQEVIKRFPDSPLYGDAWMMVGEHHFALAKWQLAIDAYKNIPESAPTSDLATFKTAWCYWKLGNSDQAARDFKRVLDKAVEAERTGTVAQRRRSASLRDEALEYLVVVFTEDRSISAQEVFDFLASIGGERYSRDVMIKVAESYAGQAEWERSSEAFRFLIKMDPTSIKAAEYQRDIVQNWTSALDVERAQDEIKVLLDRYGPRTAWAKEQRNREALERSLATTEQLVRVTATNIHGEAQRREKLAKLPKAQDGCAARPIGSGELVALYSKASEAYEQYLAAFAASTSALPTGVLRGPAKPDLAKTAAERTIELRYYRADILCFKLAKVEQAGDEYLAVGKSAPVGKFHKDALLNAMAAFEAARPKDTVGRRKLHDVDKKFGEAIDLYATLFPADPTLVGVIFKNGQMFFDYGEYDEAIKRFGVIVTKYPKDPNAGPAGDRILAALNKAQDYENIEEWARKLKGAPSFASKDQQDRLARLIVESIQKSGDKYADAGKYARAASFYLRVPKETSDARTAAQAMMNAGVMFEKAKKPEDAADIYIELAEKYGGGAPELAEKAAFSAGVVYEKVLFYDRAAKSYELVVNKFGKGNKAADALFNAGLLRQALGQHDRAVAHYKAYAQRYAQHRDAPDVAFNIGVVYQEAGQEGPAYQAFADYARTYRSSGKRIIEAHVRAGLMSYKLGQLRRARDDFATAQTLYKRGSGTDQRAGRTWAAQARYHEGELIFREYEKVTLDVPPKNLEKALKQKSKLLADAEKIYFSVIDYQDLKWATAALFRIGQVYDGFAESLVNASTPKGLSADQEQAYRDTLDMYVINIQNKAVEAFTTGYTKAIQMQVYDEYTARIREALGRLAADKFPPEREARSKERNGDRPPMLDLVMEVAR